MDRGEKGKKGKGERGRDGHEGRGGRVGGWCEHTPHQRARLLLPLSSRFVDPPSQADAHPGNILVQKRGRVALLDYGQVSPLHIPTPQNCGVAARRAPSVGLLFLPRAPAGHTI